jgi:hypothetical protein
MGAKGFDTVVRGMRDRAGPAGLPERTLAASQRTFRPGSRRAKLAAGAAALLLLALVVVGASALLGPSIGEEADRQQDVAEPPSETKTGETTATPAASEPAPLLEAAEQAVFDMYVTASYQDPNAVWPYFSRRFQEEAGSPGRWAEQERLSTLWYVYFTQYPEAEVSGDTAKVRFQVRESRTRGAEVGHRNLGVRG